MNDRNNVYDLFKGLKKGFKIQYKIMNDIKNVNPTQNQLKYDVS